MRMAERIERNARAGGAPVASEVVRLERHGGGLSWRRSCVREVVHARVWEGGGGTTGATEMWTLTLES
jgi:hypothetical protein